MAAHLAHNLLGSVRHCLSRILSLRPPDPDAEVLELLQELKLTPRHVHQMYRTFQHVRSHGVLTMATDTNEALVSSVAKVVRKERQWVAKIMKLLLELAGYRDTVTWNGFLYVSLRYCTLSKVELCQVLFFLIALEMKSWTVHFLTSTQLEEFYQDYLGCPTQSFATDTIEFSKLPLAKYRMHDFIELVYRFSQLINPCLHLQGELMHVMPHKAFWLDYDNIRVRNRRIALDFFRHKKVISIMEIIEANQRLKQKKQTQAQEDATAGAELLAAALDEEDLLLGPHIGGGGDRGEADLADSPVKRGFIPLPTRVLRTPWRPKEVEEELPPWMVEHLAGNQDPLRGVAIGSAADAGKPPEVAQALPPGWVALPGRDGPKDICYFNEDTGELAWELPGTKHEPKTVHEAKDAILQTMGPPLVRANGGTLSDGLIIKPLGRGSDVRGEEMARTMELDFVRMSRKGERRRDDIVTILHRTTPCELIDRPMKQANGRG